VANMANEVTKEVAAEPSKGVDTVFDKRFRQSFSGRPSVAGRAGRQSFLTHYKRNSAAASSRREAESSRSNEPTPEPAPTPEEKMRQQRLARLQKLEEAQRKAEEAQRKAVEYEAQIERALGGGSADPSPAPLPPPHELHRTASGKRKSTAGPGLMRRVTGAFAFGGKKQHNEPPQWATMLQQYREQLAQVEEWLATEPTEDELADGSAMQKAMTLIAARDELNGKIAQLEAVAAAHVVASGPDPNAHNLTKSNTLNRKGSLVGGTI